MPPEGAAVKIVAMSGSSRKGSFNTALLEAAKEFLPEGATLEVLDITKFPIYTKDLEPTIPEEVKEFKRKLRESDAVLFASPEFNYSVSALLKNAIEWGNRPEDDNSWEGKPAAMMSASSGPRGGARGQLHLRHILVDLNMHAVNQPQVYVGKASQAFDEGLKLKDEVARRQLQRLMVSLVEWARRLRAPAQGT